jgi:hypothetical protein
MPFVLLSAVVGDGDIPQKHSTSGYFPQAPGLVLQLLLVVEEDLVRG